MSNMPILELLPSPFQWCRIDGGNVVLDKSKYDGRHNYIPSFVQESVDPFLLAKYPITNAQYKVFIQSSGGFSSDKWWDFSADAATWRVQNPIPETPEFDSDHFPRSQISWYDAVAFCRWLSHCVGLKVELPDECQWQIASVGDTGREYPWGNNIDPIYCNYGRSVGGLTPVTQYSKGVSPYGVYDMSGNVMEWTLTSWHTGSPDFTSSDLTCVIRGGAWLETDWYARAQFRGGTSRTQVSSYLGFRVCIRNLDHISKSLENS